MNKIIITLTISLLLGSSGFAVYYHYKKSEQLNVVENQEKEEEKKNQDFSNDNKEEKKKDQDLYLPDIEKDKRESIIFFLISEMLLEIGFLIFHFKFILKEIDDYKDKFIIYKSYPFYLSYYLDTIPYELNPFSYCRNKDNDNIDKKATRSSLFDKNRNSYGIVIYNGARESFWYNDDRTMLLSSFTKLVEKCFIFHNRWFLISEIILPFLFAFFNRKKKRYLKRLKDIFLNKIYFRSLKTFILWYFLYFIIFHLIIYYLVYRLANIAAVYFFGEKEKMEKSYNQLKETADQKSDINFEWSTFFRIFGLIF